MNDRYLVKFLVESAHNLEKVTQSIAKEQSSGTFIKVAGETPELRAKHEARVEKITVLEIVDTPSIPGSKSPKGVDPPYEYKRAEVEISFPIANIGDSLIAMWTTVTGGIYELGPFSGMRLLDCEMPPHLAEHYPGPQFGIEGTRKLTGVEGRPLVGTIVKPSVGLSPEQTADLVEVLCEAGCDFIKDDELQTDTPHSPFPKRVEAVMRVIKDHADKTGKMVMYGFNLTGDIDDMLRNHDAAVKHGATCIMIDMLTIGLSALVKLRKHCQLAIHGHRAGWGALTRHPMLGMDYTPIHKFWRMGGVDHIHINGIRNKFCESDESVIKAANATLTPMFDHQTPMPVFASGQWAGQAPDTYEAIKSVDLIYLAGGGIMGHPSGPGAGVRSLIQGWEAAEKGIPLEEYAKEHSELRESIEMYGAIL